MKKKHEIDKLAEEKTKFERNAKLFDAQKQNFEKQIEKKNAAIKTFEEDKKVKEQNIDDLAQKNL